MLPRDERCGIKSAHWSTVMIPDRKTGQHESPVEQSREQRAKERPSTARSSSQNDSSRRRFLQGALGGTLVTIAAAAASLEFAAAPAAEAQSKLTPDAALQELLDGNHRFMSGKLNSFNEDLEILKQKTVDKQEPFAAVLACADSRVPVELLFDQSIGHIFVTRVAGNVVTPEIIASLEYGVAVLGTKAIVVLAHAGCGAVKATMQGQEVPGQISALYPHIQPAVDQAGHDLQAASKANAKIQAMLLREASTVIAEALKAGKLKVVAGYYDLATGAVTILD
jgi:carbonic anhydrase